VQLEQLQLVMRHRSPQEALDLGLVMLRHWRIPVYRVWFATFVPFAMLVMLVLWRWPMLTILIIWWLLPVFDRILLKVFAEASFGAAPGVSDVWRAIPGLLRHSGLLTGLTLRRFNMHRSFELPVWQLEGLGTKGCRDRLRILDRKMSGYAFWLTFVCAHFVVIFEFGLITLINIFTPSDGLDFSLRGLFTGNAGDWYPYALNAAWIAAVSIVEPFYIAAGFSLYLNRRSELEGWDIEIAFRRMAARLTDVSSQLGGATLMLLFAVTLCCPDTARATDTPATLKQPDGQIQQKVVRILADPVFAHKVEELNWQPRKMEKENVTTSSWIKQLISFIEILAIGVRGLIYVIIFFVVVALMLILYRYRHLIPMRTTVSTKQPDTLFGMNLRPESLPDDIAGAALAELAKGNHTAALSLLYRGTLLSLIHRQHIEFCVGDTEDTCLRRVNGHIDPQAVSFFAQLLDAWKLTAYAGNSTNAEHTRDLCHRWAQHFAEQGRLK
jgi:hypothetical protein